MAILKIQKTINDSIEAGYVSDPVQAAMLVCQKSADVFGDKLKQQGVKGYDTEKCFVGMSLKHDSVFIGFRGKFFDTHINIELLDANLEAMYYVLVQDKSKIDEYEAIRKRHSTSGEPPSMEYAWDTRKLLN